jgi:hypothetical protein
VSATDTRPMSDQLIAWRVGHGCANLEKGAIVFVDRRGWCKCTASLPLCNNIHESHDSISRPCQGHSTDPISCPSL